ncbi:MAG: CoA-binding protein [Proteobacteria bacterium]|nr:CoA-binding protein [Pseudomonadota bacterium]MBU1902916.1 CoA-binding protein [Pseudomonadota bacterium]
MRQFFYPANIAVFGVADTPRNLAKNIVSNCMEMGFKGTIYPVGLEPGSVHGKAIITDPGSLPEGIDLAVILIPAKYVAETLDICGRKRILHAIISTGGFREFNDQDNRAERDIISVAGRYGIRFIGPNCIGVICAGSGVCTPFNPMRAKGFKKGPVGLIVQSGGVTTQSAYLFSEEHVGFSKIISAGNKLDLNEIDFLEYLIHDEETEQIHMYLESIEDGRELTRLVRGSKKPIVIFKSNVSRTASEIAYSHTAALSNDDRIVDGALKQAGIVRVHELHQMTVAAKALQLPPLRGDRLAVISLSGGYSVILGDACERYGFQCPKLPVELMNKIEGFRRAGVIRMSNPMDFGDVHDIRALAFTLEHCLKLDNIDGVVLSFMYEPEMAKLFGTETGNPEQMLNFTRKMSQDGNKPIALSFFSERQHIEAFKKLNTFPVFNDPVESVFALRLLRDYWRGKRFF